MTYLCMTVQKEAVEEQSFAIREMAEDYFWSRFKGALDERLQEEKRKLENRIRYYERRAEKHRESLDIVELCDIRRKETEEALAQINRQLSEEGTAYRDWYYEEMQEIAEDPIFGKTELVLHLAGIVHMGDTYRVTEERYYCTKVKSAGKEGILEARKAIPENMVTNSIFLKICRENPETETRMKQEVKKMVTQIKKEFRSRTERSQLLRKPR